MKESRSVNELRLKRRHNLARRLVKQTLRINYAFVTQQRQSSPSLEANEEGEKKEQQISSAAHVNADVKVANCRESE